jgi:hypothetical protein
VKTRGSEDDSEWRDMEMKTKENHDTREIFLPKAFSERMAAEVLWFIMAAFDGRRLFATNHGVMPNFAELGDQVAIFNGTTCLWSL